jgi:O-antigen/teichoic acid export membrane protein
MSPPNRGGGKGRRASRQSTHPGGTAAIFGVSLLRFSGAQGATLGVTNLLHYGSIIAVGAILGTSGVGRYGLLLFFTGMVTQLIHILTKPGTIRRTFGTAGDDDDDVEDDDDEDATDLSDRPPWTLGVGIVLCTMLASVAMAAGIAFQSQIAGWLLGDSGAGRLVMWASITAGMSAIFRLTELVLWFERRPRAYFFIDVSRPALNLALIIALTLGGMGLEGTMLGAAIGTTVATVICLIVLRGSFQLAFNLGESLEILKQSRRRFPIVTSMWVIQNADIFILSRFVDHSDLGVYNLASRTGFVVAILPQGFRVALRPLRKSAAYRSLRREYGAQTAQGQLLAYFVLLCLTSVLIMFMLGEILVHDATGKFAAAGGLIPLSAAAMTMPALFRTISGMAIYPYKRPTFVASVLLAAAVYLGLAVLLSDMIGIYGPPVAMIVAFAIPSSYMFLRSQFGAEPIDFPYWSTLRAFVVAVALGGFFELIHPGGRWLQLAEVIGLIGVWFASLFVLRIVPEHHHAPLAHMARSVYRGSAVRFRTRAGMRSLEPPQRAALRRAVLERMTPAELEPEGALLVRHLRRAGRNGDVPVGPATEQDTEIAMFLFSDEPVASRQARMRALLSDGADTHDIRTLEDLVKQLTKAPADAWEGKPSEGPRRRFPPRLRRA